MKKYIHDKTNGIDYELVGDYYFPCLKAPKLLKIGRFGMIYHNYLRNHNRVAYSGLLLSGKLKEHIEDIDRQAKEMFFQLVEQMKQAEGITEQLKAIDQLKWVGLMNNIRNRVAEIVIKEIIYN